MPRSVGSGTLASCLVALLSTSTLAGGPTATVDETPVIAAAPAAEGPDWNGFRIGLSAAMPSGDVVWHTDTFNGGGDSNPADWSGTQGRIALGYDIQRGRMVYGVEIAQTSGDMSADIGSDNTYFGCAGTTRCGTVVSNLQEVRARVGRTYGQILFYVTAGAARADVEANIGLSNEVLGSGSVNGYSLGAGMEYALSARLSIMAE